MNRMFKWLVLLLLVLFAFVVYKVAYRTKYNYVYFGDNELCGDYVVNYFKERNILNKYFDSNQFDINSLKTAIDNNVMLDKFSIRRVLRESNLVVMYVGGNQLLKIFNDKILDSSNDTVKYYKKLDEMVLSIKEMLFEVKKYAKKNIILIGYYDNFKYIDYSDGEFNMFIKYINHQLENTCDDLGVTFIDPDALFDKKEYFEIKDKSYISEKGKQLISNLILDALHYN